MGLARPYVYNVGMNDPEKRLTDLEMSIAHLQHDFETLDKAVLDNTEKLDQVFAMLKRINQQSKNSGGDEPPRKPEDEKPPHY